LRGNGRIRQVKTEIKRSLIENVEAKIAVGICH
jgi:hypothetical protein